MIKWLVSSSLLLLASGSQQGISQHPGHHPVGFSLRGLHSPARVSGSIFVDAPDLSRSASVVYFLDDEALGSSHEAPFRLGREDGFSLDGIAPGIHHLRAEATLRTGTTISSNTVTLDLLPSISHRFGASLSPYANQRTAQKRTTEDILQRTSTPGAELTHAEIATRKEVLTMYTNWGIDPSLDRENDQSDMLLSLSPQGWAPVARRKAAEPWSLRFSPDAPFYQTIPRRWARVALPSGYLNHVQVNTVQAGDGIGFGLSTAESTDAEYPIHSQWYSNAATSKTFSFRMSRRWTDRMPWQPGGDHHMIFVDPISDTFVSSYMTSKDQSTGGAEALFASSPNRLGTMGDRGGSIAAGFAELPTMLQPGEATNPKQPIRHALGGAVARTWAARVYPASAWDANVLTSTNTCTGQGFTNTGLVPYGGVIQLDPDLDLSSLGLTLPARRILEAIQTYGYYVEDFGCSDFDLYTSISEAELDPYGGLWGYNRRGVGVQYEIERVLVNSRLFVVAPLVKKQ